MIQNDPYVARKVFYEQHWKEKIEKSLRFVEGAVVSVDVELTTELDKTTKSEMFDGEPMAESEVTKTSAIEENNGATVGLDAEETKHTPQANRSESQDEVSVKYMVPTSVSTVSTAGLVPRKVSVCISIPKSYYEAVLSHRQSKGIRCSEDMIEKEVTRNVRESVEILVPNKPSQRSAVQVVSFDKLPNSKTHASSGDLGHYLRIDGSNGILFRY
ncbi:hypothetical protein [Bythopirellula polymerisocia]|uniref:hypothetical protein n=1 Tax=Bythopirellula polymerisocia TaxID=2528003 RepID=UPI0011B7D672|nr:hypothetical protein [Bythopirellula polymerisocia]